ncbi:transposase [Clostridium saccharoperbutylacetonicum]|uniref:transposase n=1 Tax=Clostridium saccharoperbutylacetonicum TaxID=36745 RepID=UPI0039EA5810
MPRKKHEWYTGAKLHIIARGNRRNDIFRNEKDYELYLNYLLEAIEYYENKYKVIAYVLMTNHVHIMIETTDKDISDLIKRVHGRYALNFNKKYNYIGHLFQDRYMGKLIKDDNYMLALSRYVHLNPVRAGIVEKPGQYKWSSYNVFIGQKEESIVNADIVLDHFKNDSKLYKEFVEGTDHCKKLE